MRDPSRVRLDGPLEPFAAGLVAELYRLGYARPSVIQQMQLVAHLSRWMAAEGVAVAELTSERVEAFIVSRRAAGYRHFLKASSLAPLLGYLRRLGVTPWAAVGLVVAPADVLVGRYRDYLLAERGLAATTLRFYERVARQFLGTASGPSAELDLARLTAGDVGRFVLAECGRVSPRSSWAISTGGPASCSCVARLAAAIGCRCPSMSARRWPAIYAAAAHAWSLSGCSCVSSRRSDR